MLALAGRFTSNKRRLFSRSLLIAAVAVLAVLVVSLELASSRDSRRPGVIPPAEAPDGFRFLFSIAGGPDSRLVQPLAVAVGPRGQVYVADAGHRAVQVFDAGGEWQRSIGHSVDSDPQPGDLVYPLGLTLDHAGNLYVTDSTGGHVSVFDARGQFLGYFAEDGQGRKSFRVPAGIFFRDGLLYLNDIGAHRVVALRADGTIERTIGSGRGVAIGQMIYPNYSWVDHEGRVYVADSNNNRVQIFGPDGSAQRVLVSGHADSGVNLLRGIALDSRGYLHVANTTEHRVMVFDGEGAYLYSYGGEGEGATQLGFPNGLTIANDQVYVADRANNRVQVWTLGARHGSRN